MKLIFPLNWNMEILWEGTVIKQWTDQVLFVTNILIYVYCVRNRTGTMHISWIELLQRLNKYFSILITCGLFQMIHDHISVFHAPILLGSFCANDILSFLYQIVSFPNIVASSASGSLWRYRDKRFSSPVFFFVAEMPILHSYNLVQRQKVRICYIVSTVLEYTTEMLKYVVQWLWTLH